MLDTLATGGRVRRADAEFARAARTDPRDPGGRVSSPGRPDLSPCTATQWDTEPRRPDHSPDSLRTAFLFRGVCM